MCCESIIFSHYSLLVSSPTRAFASEECKLVSDWSTNSDCEGDADWHRALCRPCLSLLQYRNAMIARSGNMKITSISKFVA